MTFVRPVAEPAPRLLAEARTRAAALASAAEGKAFAVAALPIRRPADTLEAFREVREGVRLAFLQPERGFSIVGIGIAAAWPLNGPDPLSEAAGLLRSMPPAAVAGDAPPRELPIVFAGVAFCPGDRAPHWGPFGNGLLVVPRVLLLVEPAGAWRVETELVGTEGRAIPARLPQPPAAGPFTDRAATQAEWTAAVLRALDRIARGEATKVVVAREAYLPEHRSADEALAVLVDRFPTCTVFAVDLGGPCFLGATPERLASVSQGTFELMALAGTAPRGADSAEDDAIAARLAADRKEREEHAVVVRALREDVAPLVSELEVAPEPEVVRLPNLQHLRTLLRGRLRDGCSLFDLAARLHPTPAVGGMPREAAARIIAEVETFDRGWYAGPLGWADARGDGELVVALRSALLTPGQPARLFAGCGIVARSDPEREFSESELKLRAIRSALVREEGS
ncbi:Salicylate biosynthesis isochorismate synthase [bacterium HR29]|nr:Salicylate biosynthesis isochorismate synthase [bacterium HR29]